MSNPPELAALSNVVSRARTLYSRTDADSLPGVIEAKMESSLDSIRNNLLGSYWNVFRRRHACYIDEEKLLGNSYETSEAKLLDEPD